MGNNVDPDPPDIEPNHHSHEKMYLGIGNELDGEEFNAAELPIKIPIVGFETMEERAKFTIFKLRVESQRLDDNWLVFRRYTDFVRLHSKLKDEVSNLEIPIPPKRWLRDNFETSFLEERMKGLQGFVDSILVQPRLVALPTIRKFFCLDEPPVYSDTAEETKSWYGMMEDSSVLLKHKLNEKDHEIELLRAELALVTMQRDNILKLARNCRSCNQKYPGISSMNLTAHSDTSTPIGLSTALPSSSSSSDHGSPRRGPVPQLYSSLNKPRKSSVSSRTSSTRMDSPGHSRNIKELNPDSSTSGIEHSTPQTDKYNHKASSQHDDTTDQVLSTMAQDSSNHENDPNNHS